ncbi:GNAT family N-acetyltransferase [Colwellia ponticola]|uniref:GNAT family N-acetyltransferase n=1 Tax=Colwellia ponticola TaxID=2304625 RepID=A0A8H2JJ29_9GAMM|nr:GNAT family N-acetyltransferase [Colwellia ponticola]TMM41935.1 GNAT family N-acetyltransferase [Colwellia ponticola]
MSYSISQVEWQQAAPLLKSIREKVFVCERRIPKKIEFDHDDTIAYHMLVCDDKNQEPIATGRISPQGEISRIAVVMSYRSERIDIFILQGLFRIADKLTLKEVFISSPLEKVTYFTKHGFYPVGSVYMEAGMAKQRMACATCKAVKHIKKAKYYLSH